MMPLTGSSREMGNFYDLSWGSDGWFLSPCVHGLFGFFFVVSQKFNFLLVSFGRFI